MILTAGDGSTLGVQLDLVPQRPPHNTALNVLLPKKKVSKYRFILRWTLWLLLPILNWINAVKYGLLLWPDNNESISAFLLLLPANSSEEVVH
jgi:hypothetical protein